MKKHFIISRPEGERTACAYVRVSSDEQAKHKTSIASQISSIADWCDKNQVALVEVFSEPGLSGTDDTRPEFNRMMTRATAPDRPYDMVVVHSLSRFARDLALQAVSYKRLQEAGVEQVSVTEQFGKGAGGNLVRAVVSAFNEHQSAETSKHTRRTMRANAMEGYWNGGRVPFGFRSVTVEVRGTKEKKRLELADEEAAVVRLMYDLAIKGCGDGPMGARDIAKWLNARGYTLKEGRFHNSNVADILGRTHNTGSYLDGKTSDLGEPLPEAEWVRVPCPAIIDPDTFMAAAAIRASRRPRATPPRVVNGVTMLPSRVARCGMADCGAGLTVRSGKGGRYHYYACEHRVNRSADACTLPAIRRETLDEVVLDALLDRVLDPDHLQQLLAGLLERSDEADGRRRRALAVARTTRTEAEKAIGNLLTLVEKGTMPADSREVVERIAFQRARQQIAATEIDSIERQLAISRKRITPAIIAEFGQMLRAKLVAGDPNFRRSYVVLLVEKVTLSADQISITGTRSALEHMLVSDKPPLAGPVPTFDRDWCQKRTRRGLLRCWNLAVKLHYAHEGPPKGPPDILVYLAAGAPRDQSQPYRPA